ncbi:MAG: hypothetical protein R3A44_10495 [Caldilineaceae bacterium]
MTTVTLDLPQELYRHALRTAKATQRPIEQVVVEWIQLPSEEADLAIQDELVNLENLTNDELIQIAQAITPAADSERLQALLALQEQRALTPSERKEAEYLVAQEDLLTLRKAKALFLLKKRQALPEMLAQLLQ